MLQYVRYLAHTIAVQGNTRGDSIHRGYVVVKAAVLVLLPVVLLTWGVNAYAQPPFVSEIVDATGNCSGTCEHIYRKVGAAWKTFASRQFFLRLAL